MAITLTKEDGTQVAGANTFVTQAEADTFFEGYFDSAVWTAASSGDKDKALYTAALILERQFIWKGRRVGPDTQAMQWPRWGVQEADREVDSNEVPQAIQDAQCLIAQSILANTSFATVDPAAGGGDTLAGISLGKGALKIDYATPAGSKVGNLRYGTVVSIEALAMLEPFGRFRQGGSMRRVHRG